GKNFDPNLHEAVSFSSEEGKDSGIIISEMRQGYMIHDRVLRASMVSVAGDAGESEKEKTDDKLVDVQEGGD
ncbi:MAG: nucleotide exchange factor GrpE, partial [Nitrososphaerales archaeon]